MSVSRVVVVSLLALSGGCEGTTAVRLDIRGSLTVPNQVDSLCVSIAAIGATGEDETFHGRYDAGDLEGGFPQSIVVTPGEHDQAQAWVRALRGGVEVARAGARFSFASESVVDVPLDLGRCPSGEPLAPTVVDTDDGTGEVRVVAALGWRSPVLLALGAGVAQRYRAEDGQLTALEGGLPAPPAALPETLLPLDVDGDCDDDVVFAAPGASPEVWLQGPDGELTAGPALAVGEARALAGADVNGDGHLDLAVGGGSASILFGSGQGTFTEDGGALQGELPVDVTAMAFGDLSGDGAPELVVGQGSAMAQPNLVFLNESGVLIRADAVLPALALLTRGIAVSDVTGDGAGDLVVAAEASRVRIYVNRGGLLEDRTFLLLPSADSVDAAALSVDDLDGDCLADIVVGLTTGAPLLWRATPAGVFEVVTLDAATSGTYPVLADADGDGARDLLIGGPGGVVWAEP